MLLQKWGSWSGPYLLQLTTDIIAKFQGAEPWVHTSQIKKAPPDIWYYINAGAAKSNSLGIEVPDIRATYFI